MSYHRKPMGFFHPMPISPGPRAEGAPGPTTETVPLPPPQPAYGTAPQGTATTQVMPGGTTGTLPGASSGIASLLSNKKVLIGAAAIGAAYFLFLRK